ncbi:hypothetical protein HDU86_007893 [Geranomyces michiganensis]|nr:hypothetical protein HDU86_007893 [Geranomyces michiganensis]
MESNPLPELPRELWRRILTLLVHDELAPLSPEWDLHRAPPLSLLPVSHRLRCVNRLFDSEVQAIFDAARSTDCEAFWDPAGGRVWLPELPLSAAFSLRLALVGGGPASALEATLAAAPNVRRLYTDSVHPNQFFEAASRLCSAVVTIVVDSWEPRNNKVDTDVQIYLGYDVLEQALRRWHAAGYGGLRNLAMPWNHLVINDRLALVLAETCPFFQTFTHPGSTHSGEVKTWSPQWVVSEAAWDAWVDSANYLTDFDWGEFDCYMYPESRDVAREHYI